MWKHFWFSSCFDHFHICRVDYMTKANHTCMLITWIMNPATCINRPLWKIIFIFNISLLFTFELTLFSLAPYYTISHNFRFYSPGQPQIVHAKIFIIQVIKKRSPMQCPSQLKADFTVHIPAFRWLYVCWHTEPASSQPIDCILATWLNVCLWATRLCWTVVAKLMNIITNLLVYLSYLKKCLNGYQH